MSPAIWSVACRANSDTIGGLGSRPGPRDPNSMFDVGQMSVVKCRSKCIPTMGESGIVKEVFMFSPKDPVSSA